ncbi:MATE family efflux transporter [Photobacterium swingsii]|uniref:MATE family efflux transporter n=1 Tax=Photobacterium swingsii TaxID=680026 RepID=UPI00406908A2
MFKSILQLLKLAFPVLVAQMAQTLMGFVDTVMVGQVSALNVAAVALGNSIWLPTIIVVGGAIMALPAMVAHHYGSQNYEAIRRLIIQGIYMALVCSLIAAVFLYCSRFGIEQITKNSSLSIVTGQYLLALMCGAPAFLLFQCLRGMTEGMSVTKPSMIIGFTGFLVNIPANYLFIYGGFGIPAMGGVGSGIATALVYWVMLFTLIGCIAFSNTFRPVKLFSGICKVDRVIQRQLIKQGMPIAIAVFLEVAVFACISVALSPLGTNVIASNQIAVNFTTLTMMIPLAIGTAVTVRVGYVTGQGQLHQAQNIIRSGLIITTITSFLVMITISCYQKPIVSLYSADIDVHELGMKLLICSALFQLPNAIQMIYVAGLRGLRDTLPIMYVALTCYWVIGMTIGFLLGFTDTLMPKQGAVGAWLGFILGLSFASVALRRRFNQRLIRL